MEADHVRFGGPRDSFDLPARGQLIQEDRAILSPCRHPPTIRTKVQSLVGNAIADFDNGLLSPQVPYVEMNGNIIVVFHRQEPAVRTEPKNGGMDAEAGQAERFLIVRRAADADVPFGITSGM